MNQTSSVQEIPYSVSWALMPDNREDPNLTKCGYTTLVILDPGHCLFDRPKQILGCDHKGPPWAVSLRAKCPKGYGRVHPFQPLTLPWRKYAIGFANRHTTDPRAEVTLRSEHCSHLGDRAPGLLQRVVSTRREVIKGEEAPSLTASDFRQRAP